MGWGEGIGGVAAGRRRWSSGGAAAVEGVEVVAMEGGDGGGRLRRGKWGARGPDGCFFVHLPPLSI